MLRWKYIALNNYSKKRISWINNIKFCLSKLEKEEQTTFKASRRRDIIKIQGEINEIENIKIEKISKKQQDKKSEKSLDWSGKKRAGLLKAGLEEGMLLLNTRDEDVVLMPWITVHQQIRTDSLERTLMLGKIEGWRRKGPQRMRWLDDHRLDGQEFE